MTFRTLIFDLDDTLLDTWGQLVKPAAKEACAAMIEAGLAASLDLALATRESLFSQHPRADVYELMVQHLGVRNGADKAAVRDAGFRAYFDRAVEPSIHIPEETRSFLEDLQSTYRLFLVTTGFPETQRQKVEILQLEPYFQAIHYVHPESGQTKKDVFQAILDQEAHPAKQTLVIGDRPDREIAAGNALGMTTVRIRAGEFGFIEPEHPHEEAHFTVQAVIGVLTILAMP